MPDVVCARSAKVTVLNCDDGGCNHAVDANGYHVRNKNKILCATAHGETEYDMRAQAMSLLAEHWVQAERAPTCACSGPTLCL